MKKVIGIGKQSFEDIIQSNCFYIDKTSLIKEWWESEDDITLITRPRRFGKTLNMDMLKCFFPNQYRDQGQLFVRAEYLERGKISTVTRNIPSHLFKFCRCEADKL